MKPTDKRRTRQRADENASYLPSEAELAERIAEVQSRWTEHERQRRIVGATPERIEIQIVPTRD